MVFAIVGCFADVSGEHVYQIFSDQTFLLDCLTSEDGADRLYRNVDKNYLLAVDNNPEDLEYRIGSLIQN